MTTANDTVNFVKDLANRGQGVDFDGWYGMQCVDLPNWICGKFFGKPLWGDAIDLIQSAKQHGFEVHYMPTSARPRPGAIFVKNYWAGGRNYGHTGVIIGVSGDVVQTVEQNIVGNLDVGGPAQYSSQRISNLVGWFYPPYASAVVKEEHREQKEEEEEMNFVLRSHSGKQGYVAIVNGNVFGIGNMDTVAKFKSIGFKELMIDDADFSRFIDSQKADDERLLTTLNEIKDILKNK
ncbi:TPA: CHAP domain-containing protein [Streptococcus suis]